jgi:hypothetical protein
MCGRAYAIQQALEPWLSQESTWIERQYVTPVIHAYAFAGPWLSSSQLLLSLQFELFVFGVDKLIDTDATSRREVEEYVESWTIVARGGIPREADRPGVALEKIREQLSESTLWPALGGCWEQLFSATFRGMLEEWDSAAALHDGHAPTFDEYLANSDSCGFRIIRMTDWIASEEAAVRAHLEILMEASWHAEIASRLTNDLRSHAREKDHIDLNAIKLGAAPEQIVARADEARQKMTELLDPLLRRSVPPAVFLDRILRFGNAFYEIADFR